MSLLKPSEGPRLVPQTIDRHANPQESASIGRLISIVVALLHIIILLTTN